MQELHSAERSVVHVVLAHDVARTWVALELRLEGGEAFVQFRCRGAVGGCGGWWAVGIESDARHAGGGGDLFSSGDLYGRHEREVDIDLEIACAVEVLRVNLGRVHALLRRHVVERARQRAEVVGAVRRVGDERLFEQRLERHA